ncbi:tropomyosin-2-like [Nicotiana tomentosiformis]|uniref:tropomyosin-2-like n=1 Tax=Nicotiana tomentosiformis TaxID=4098 RepID=UPI00388C56BC
MKRVIIEVPEGGNLLRKSGQADMWLKPLLGPVEKKKLEGHNSLTLMNDIVHSFLKMDQQVIELRTEVDNWKEQFEGLQLKKEVLAEEKNALEQQMRMVSAELAVEKSSSSQVGKDKDILESPFAKQLSKATEEIRSLKELLNQKEIYAGELVQTLTQAQEYLRISTHKIQFLKSSLAPLKTTYEASEAENEELRAEIDQWQKDYEALEDNLSLDVSWNTRLEILIEANQEGFDLNAEIYRAKEVIDKT